MCVCELRSVGLHTLSYQIELFFSGFVGFPVGLIVLGSGPADYGVGNIVGQGGWFATIDNLKRRQTCGRLTCSAIQSNVSIAPRV